MKKIGYVILALFMVSAAVYLFTDHEELYWRWTAFKNSTDAYQKYLNSAPQGRYVTQAKSAIDELLWKEANQKQTLDGFEKYVKKSPKGKYVNQALVAIDEFYWKEASRAFSVAGFKGYLLFHANGYHIAEAKANLSKLQAALKQETRPLEGTVGKVDQSTGILVLNTIMGKTETFRLPEDTFVHRVGVKRSLTEITKAEGVRIDYVNLGETLLIRKIAIGHSVSQCSCGDSCTCPLSRGCRKIKY